MPHVIVKTVTGHGDEQKRDLTARIVKAVMEVFDLDLEDVSVAIDDVPPERWMDLVYGPAIAADPQNLTQRPGYGPLA